jgi:phage protein U
MLNEVMMALGEKYRFAIATAAYSELKKVTEYRWSQTNRIGRGPAAQFVGIGKQEITLTGTVYPHFKGGLKQLDDMRIEASKGIPLLLVDGLGFVHDYHCITRIEETQTRFDIAGVPLKQEFNLTMIYYGVDNKISNGVNNAI